MDELCRAVESALDVTDVGTVVQEVSSHPRINLYKNKGRAAEQEKRWREELEAARLKRDRYKSFDNNRRELSPDGGDDDLEGSMDDQTAATPWSSTPQLTGKSWRSHSSRLMLAEWLLFEPENFQSDYHFKLCPKGRHVYVLASKGKTRIFSRTGRQLFCTVSRLPGGGLGQGNHQNQSYRSQLDCILTSGDAWSKSPSNKSSPNSQSTEGGLIELKVLDLMSMRHTSYRYLTCRERIVWIEHYLREQIEEFQETDAVRFSVLPSYPCDEMTMKEVFSTKPPFEVDGVLLYHGEGIYKQGATPLVGWLKPYMLPEWFPFLQVHPDFMKDCSPDYTDYLNEIKRYEEEATNVRAKEEKKMES